MRTLYYVIAATTMIALAAGMGKAEAPADARTPMLTAGVYTDQ